MACHPSHGKKTPRREVQKQHVWKAWHHPDEPEIQPGDQHFKVEYFDPSDPKQRHLLTGGPESGMPCPCAAHPGCVTMTRVGGSATMRDILSQPEVEVVNKNMMTEEDWQRLESREICALVCPSCLCLTQMWREFLPSVIGG